MLEIFADGTFVLTLIGSLSGMLGQGLFTPCGSWNPQLNISSNCIHFTVSSSATECFTQVPHSSVQHILESNKFVPHHHVRCLGKKFLSIQKPVQPPWWVSSIKPWPLHLQPPLTITATLAHTTYCYCLYTATACLFRQGVNVATCGYLPSYLWINQGGVGWGG